MIIIYNFYGFSMVLIKSPIETIENPIEIPWVSQSFSHIISHDTVDGPAKSESPVENGGADPLIDRLSIQGDAGFRWPIHRKKSWFYTLNKDISILSIMNHCFYSYKPT